MANLDLAQNLAIGESVNKVCYTAWLHSNFCCTSPFTSRIEY